MPVPINEKIAIGLPRGADTGFKYEFLESLMMMFGRSPCQYKMISVDKVHHVARNEIIDNFLGTDFNYLLFIDSDMIWEPDSLELAYDLIQHPTVDIVTGIYFTKGAPHLPVIKKLDLDAGCYNIFVEWGNQPFEVDGAGMGFMLISRKVLEAMKQPMCTWDGGFSEDLNFLLKAKKDHGFKIWAHPGIKLGHIGTKVITNFDYMQQFKPGIKAYIRETMVGTKRYLQEQYPDWRKTLGIDPMSFKNINTKEYWDSIYQKEGGADKNWRDYPEKYEYIIKNILGDLQSDAKVLELGCGVGIFANHLKNIKPSIDYCGIDISQVAIDELHKNGLKGGVQNIPPIEELPPEWAGTEVDIVVGLEFLEHLDQEPREQTIKEIYKLIGKTGRAILSVPDDCMGAEDVSEHRVKYNKETFNKFLKKEFKNVNLYQIPSRPSTHSTQLANYLVAVCDNKQKNFINSKKENNDTTIQK
jgi:2-polyprenyl-3-methyl-5-hydroxy-6-metoxy-1,4-benzoquinol methylase